MVELELVDVSKTFAPARVALDQVSFTLTPGECLAILGPSGCGKTTLLRVIAGLEAPTSGEIRFNGARVNDVVPHRRRVAMHFQRPALIPQHTVRRHLRSAWTFGSLWPWRSSPREAELIQMAHRLGLANDLDRPVGQLSGGQQQRVALGRCLLRPAKIRLFDEPLGHLDAPLRVELRRLLRALIEEHRATTLHVTHDPDEAMALGDRIAVLNDGALVQLDKPERLMQAPANRFVAELMHQPSGGLNVVAGFVRQDGLDTYFENPLGRWPMPAQTISALHESLQSSKILQGAADSANLVEAKNFEAQTEKVPIIVGIAANDVRCTSQLVRSDEDVCLQLPMQTEERSLTDTWVLAGHEVRWTGRPEADERLERGQVVMMTFSMSRAYWFDALTGRTLVAPTG